MDAYKLEILVIDFDGVGKDGIRDMIAHARYPNHAISPSVESIEVRDIGAWHDSHPLNNRNTASAEFKRLFAVSAIQPVMAAQEAPKPNLQRQFEDIYGAHFSLSPTDLNKGGFGDRYTNGQVMIAFEMFKHGMRAAGGLKEGRKIEWAVAHDGDSLPMLAYRGRLFRLQELGDGWDSPADVENLCASLAAPVAPAKLPKWIDDKKGSDPTMDSVIQWIEKTIAPVARVTEREVLNSKRYEWLRKQDDSKDTCAAVRALTGPYFNTPLHGEKLDAQIDAAMRAAAPTPPEAGEAS